MVPAPWPELEKVSKKQLRETEEAAEARTASNLAYQKAPSRKRVGSALLMDDCMITTIHFSLSALDFLSSSCRKNCWKRFGPRLRSKISTRSKGKWSWKWPKNGGKWRRKGRGDKREKPPRDQDHRGCVRWGCSLGYSCFWSEISSFFIGGGLSLDSPASSLSLPLAASCRFFPGLFTP